MDEISSKKFFIIFILAIIVVFTISTLQNFGVLAINSDEYYYEKTYIELKSIKKGLLGHDMNYITINTGENTEVVKVTNEEFIKSKVGDEVYLIKNKDGSLRTVLYNEVDFKNHIKGNEDEFIELTELNRRTYE